MEHQLDDFVGEAVDDVPKREPDEYCNARRTRDGAFIGYCKRTSGWGTDRDSGRCSSHGGSGGSSDDHEGNDWASTHGAYSASFVKGFLTEKEIERVEQFEELTDTAEGAQAFARTAAGIAMEQFRRTGDQRFLQRVESLCDTFGIAPADEVDINHSGDVNQTLSLDEETAAAIRGADLSKGADDE